MSYVQVPPDSTGKLIATNEILGQQYQIVNLADATGAALEPLTDTQLRANPLTVLIDSVAINPAEDTITGTDIALTTHSVITGETTAGGGSYVNVKVNPSGALAVSVGDCVLPTGAATEATLDALNTKTPALGQALMAASVPVVIASNQDAVPVSASALPLPAGAATEATLDAINDKLPTASASMPSSTASALPIRQLPQQYWDWSFAKAITNNVDTTKGTLIRTGSGQSVNQSGGNLVITAGTTANAETVIRSLESWSGALTAWGAVTLSQRIVNNNFFLELVDVIGDGLAYNIVSTTLVDVTKASHGFTSENVGQRMDLCALSSVGVPMEGVIQSIPDANTIRFTVSGYPASGSGTLSLTGWNKIELNYTGTTATNVNFNTRRQGYQNTAVAATINTSASGHQYGINQSGGVCSLSDQVLTSAGAFANRNAWKLNVPEQGVELYYQIRCKNGTTNPASGTTWTIGMLRVEDYIAQQVELTNTRQQSSGNSLPVTVISAPTTAVTMATQTPTLAASNARAAFIAASGIWYDDSSATLLANATFTGTSRDLTVTATATTFANAATYAQELRVSAESDVTGTLWLEVSRDNSNWRRVKSVATSAVTGGGFAAEIVHRPSWRYARVGYTNGAGGQARFTIGSFLMAI